MIVVMTVPAEEVRRAALTLTVAERAELANTLLASLDERIEDTDVVTAWTDEVNRRVDELVAGRVATVPWAEVKAQLAADRDARRP